MQRIKGRFFLLSVIVTLFSSYCLAQSVPTIEHWDKERKIKRSEGVLLDGLEHGTWYYYYKNGALQEQVNFEKGMKSGEAKSFYISGELKAKTNFLRNREDGLFESFYPNGEKMTVGNYKAAYKIGEWLTFWPNQTLKTKVMYTWDDPKFVTASDSAGTETMIDGNGSLYTYFSDGSLQSKITYKDSVKHGDFKEYYFSGALSCAGNFKSGKQHGKLECYYSDGNIKSVRNYTDGIEDGVALDLSTEGDTLFYTLTNKGVANGRIVQAYPNKIREYDGYTSGGEKHGVWNFYYPSGVVQNKAQYNAGKKTGD